MIAEKGGRSDITNILLEGKHNFQLEKVRIIIQGKFPLIIVNTHYFIVPYRASLKLFLFVFVNCDVIVLNSVILSHEDTESDYHTVCDFLFPNNKLCFH